MNKSMDEKVDIINVLFWLQIILLVVGSSIAVLHLTDSITANPNLLKIASSSLFIGLVVTIIRLQIIVEKLNTKISSSLSQTNYLTKEALRLRVSLQKIEELKRVENLFLDNNSEEGFLNFPQIEAYKKTGKSFGINNTIKMATKFSAIKSGDSIIVEDPKLTEDYLINIVESIENIGRKCIWLGTSKVFRPEGWKNKEIDKFVTTLRAKAEKNKVKVYRTFMIDESRNDVEKIVENLQPVINTEKTKGVITSIYKGVVDVSDMSILLAAPRKILENDSIQENVEPPFISRDEISEDSWSIIFALEWKIINGNEIGNVTVHSNPRKTIGFYDDFQKVWNKSSKEKFDNGENDEK